MQNISPGTVSKILWHFTGGPEWNDKAKKQKRRPKPEKKAFENLSSILQYKHLRVGDYKEVVKVILPERVFYDRKKQRIEEFNVPVDVESAPVCCLADIPAPNLAYHAKRYGKFAIGFHRESVIKHGFNPVFYTLKNTDIVRSIYQGFSSLELVDLSTFEFDADDIRSGIDRLSRDYDDLASDITSRLDDIDAARNELEDYFKDAHESLRQFMAFVKTFSSDEFATIYCEREWRSTKDFMFTMDDVAMIVIPKNSKTNYFQQFVNEIAHDIGIPRAVPIVPWEDFAEH